MATGPNRPAKEESGMSHAYTFEDATYVQFFLDNLENLETFSVIFLKKNGEQRKLTGNLDPNGTTRKVNVPVQTDEGWKSFDINKVLWIGKE